VTKPEPAEVAAPSTAELGRQYSAECLHSALIERLRADACEPLAEEVERFWQAWGDAGGDAVIIAGMLILRLRAEGSGKLADALSSLMSEAGAAPMFSFPYSLQEYKEHPDATLLLRGDLFQRLRRDGHGELVGALRELIAKYPSRTPCTAPPPELGSLVPVADEPESHWPTADERAQGTGLAAAHDARTLLDALFARLHDEGREGKIGYLMLGWVLGVVGPIVDPRKVADALIERLRMPATIPARWAGASYEVPNPALADAIEPLLNVAAIDRNPQDLLRTWEEGIMGPIVANRPLAARLVEALRLVLHSAHPGLVDAVRELLESAEPPLLDRRPPPPTEDS
jgi:hypothetical protein